MRIALAMVRCGIGGVAHADDMPLLRGPLELDTRVSAPVLELGAGGTAGAGLRVAVTAAVGWQWGTRSHNILPGGLGVQVSDTAASVAIYSTLTRNDSRSSLTTTGHCLRVAVTAS